MNCLKNNLKKFIWLLIITLFIVILYLYRSNLKFLYNLLSIGSVEEVTLVIRSWGIGAPIISILLMAFQSIIAPIPAFLITGANGRIFGIFWGTTISWIGAMLGGILSFYLARWFGEAFVKKILKMWEYGKK